MNNVRVLRMVIFLLVILLMANIGCTTASDKHVIMIDEYKMITPFPDATLVDTSSVARIGRSMHGKKYRSGASWEEVSSHYSNQLEQNGWMKIDEAPSINGGRCLSYKKEDLLAKLEFGTSTAWAFALDLSWNGSRSCQ